MGRYIWTKKMIIAGLILFSFSEFLFGVGNQIWVLFLSRALGGVSAACMMPAVTAFIADTTSLENRAKALGIYQQLLVQDSLLDLVLVALYLILAYVHRSFCSSNFWYRCVFFSIHFERTCI